MIGVYGSREIMEVSACLDGLPVIVSYTMYAVHWEHCERLFVCAVCFPPTLASAWPPTWRSVDVPHVTLPSCIHLYRTVADFTLHVHSQ